MSGEKTEVSLGVKIKKWWKGWLKDTKLALQGVGIVMQRPGYIAIGVVAFLVFAYFFAIFQDGGSTWSLLWSGLPFGDKLGLLGGVWGAVVRNLVDPWGVVLTLLAMLQGLCVALLVYSIRKRVAQKELLSGVEAGGVGMAISMVILGCPACGTSVLVPFLTMVMGSSAMAFVGAIGSVLTVVAVVLLLFAVRRLGYGAYLETTGVCKKRKKKDVAKS